MQYHHWYESIQCDISSQISLWGHHMLEKLALVT